MALIKNQEKKVDWLQVIIIFVLGLLIATSVFLFISIRGNQSQISDLKLEIEKLKADDIALAQAINNMTTQLQALGILKQPQPTNK